MTHLRIEQGGTTEYVTPALIHKLYQYAKEIKDYEEDPNNNFSGDSLVSLKGNLSVPKAYGDEVDWLETKFSPDLHITTTLGRYIRFADSEVERVLSASWGDGNGITLEEAVLKTSIPTRVFRKNTTITSFDELGQFPNIKDIHTECFEGCTGLTSIDLSNIETFGAYDAFYGCTGLTGVINLPSARTISSSTFIGCTGITQVNFGENFTGIRDTTVVDVFKGCTSLTTITGLSGNIFSGGMFSGCSNLTTISGLSGVFEIKGNNTFNNCSSLTSNNFTNVKFKFTTATGCFKNCTSLTSITLDDSVTHIPDECFSGCSNLSSINLSNITSIGRSALTNCNLNFTDLDLSNVTSIGQYCFKGCSELKGTLNLSGVQTVNALTTELFSGCSGLLKIILGHVSSVATSRANSNRSTFYQCNSLKIVDINQLDSIFFSNNKLINNSVFLAFIIRNTDTIPTITLDYNTSNAEWSKFTSSSNAKIYVDDNLYSTYINHADWSDLASHIEPLSNYVES